MINLLKTIFSLIVCSLLASCATTGTQEVDTTNQAPAHQHQSQASLEAAKMISPVR